MACSCTWLTPWSGFAEQVWIVGILYASRLTLSSPCKVVQVWLSVCCSALIHWCFCLVADCSTLHVVFRCTSNSSEQHCKANPVMHSGQMRSAQQTLCVCWHVCVCLCHWYTELLHFASLTAYTLTKEISILFASFSVVFCLWLWMNLLL